MIGVARRCSRWISRAAYYTLPEWFRDTDGADLLRVALPDTRRAAGASANRSRDLAVDEVFLTVLFAVLAMRCLVPAEPQRVVSVGVTEQDVLLQLGVVPVAVTEWYGEQPDATWPWAHDLLDGAHPEVLHTDNGLEFEKIAALHPDLIVGTNAGLTKNRVAHIHVEEEIRRAEFHQIFAADDRRAFGPFRRDLHGRGLPACR